MGNISVTEAAGLSVSPYNNLQPWLPPQAQGLTVTPAGAKHSVEWQHAAALPEERLHKPAVSEEWASASSKEMWSMCCSACSMRGAFSKSLKLAEQCTCVCRKKAPLLILYVQSSSHLHRRATTLADRRLHSFKPPSGLHQSVILFNNRPGALSLYTHTHTNIKENASRSKRSGAIFMSWDSSQHLWQLNIKKPRGVWSYVKANKANLFINYHTLFSSLIEDKYTYNWLLMENLTLATLFK